MAKQLFVVPLLLWLACAQVLPPNPNSPIERPTYWMSVIAIFSYRENFVPGSGPTEQCVIDGKGPGALAGTTSARSTKVVAEAMYNAWARFDEAAEPTVRYRQYAPVPPEQVTQEDMETAVTVAAVLAIEYLMPERSERVQLRRMWAERLYGVDVTDMTDMVVRQATYGVEALIADVWSNDGWNHDGCFADTSNFMATNDPCVLDDEESIRQCAKSLRNPLGWSPIVRHTTGPHAPRRHLTPHIGFATTFSGISQNEMRVSTPGNIRNPGQTVEQWFEEQMRAVVRDGGRLWDNNSLLKALSETMTNGPLKNGPASQWQDIVAYVLDNTPGSTIGDAVKLQLAVAAAAYDAMIGVYLNKRTYSSVRPVTYMATQLTDESFNGAWTGPYCPPATVKGWQWQPYQPIDEISPPHAEYLSGHAGLAAACAEVLTLVTGDARFPSKNDPWGFGPLVYSVPAGTSSIEPQCGEDGTNMYGEPCTFGACASDPSHNSTNSFTPPFDISLSYPTYERLAVAQGISRGFGGLHIPTSVGLGQRLGQTIGRRVATKVQALWTANARDEQPNDGGGDEQPTVPDPPAGAPPAKKEDHTVQEVIAGTVGVTALAGFLFIFWQSYKIRRRRRELMSGLDVDYNRVSHIQEKSAVDA